MMSNVQLPDEYVPTQLRSKPPQPRSDVAYACGWRVSTTHFGEITISNEITHGPFPTIEDALETVRPNDPRRTQSKIEVVFALYRLNRDGTDEELYHWFAPRTGTPRWRRIKQ